MALTDEQQWYRSPALLATLDAEGRPMRLNARFLRRAYVFAGQPPRPWLACVHPDDRQVAGEVLALLRAGAPEAGCVARLACEDGSYETLVWRFVPDPERAWYHAACWPLPDAPPTSAATVPAAPPLAPPASESAPGSVLLAAVGHEIRTPMHGLLGMLALLRDTPLSGEQRDLVAALHISAEALLGVLGDLLDLAGTEPERCEPQSAPFDLRAVLVNPVLVHALHAAQRGVDLVVRTPAVCPGRLVGDALRLRQVLTNVLSNAVKFTPSGHILVEAHCESVLPDAARLTISVEDTGVGMAPEQLDRLFDAPQAPRPPLARDHGLAVSRALLARLGGELDAVSDLGCGSTFRFRVPVGLDPDAEPPSRPASNALRGARMLVVDRTEAACDAAAEMLIEAGARAEGVGSGEEAVVAAELAQTQRDGYAVVWIGHRPPALDGLAVCRRLREVLAAATPALVLVLPAGEPLPYHALRQAGARGCLHKPLWPWDLHNVAAALLQHPAAELVTPHGPVDASALADSAGPAEERATVDGRAAQVLVVDDNPLNLDVARRLLGRFGCVVELAGGGLEALEKARVGRYDLIFMDCHMPDMDGFAATQAIRRGETGPRTPIIALTAAAQKGDRERCLAAGMDDYLAKPVQIPALRGALLRWLPRSAALAGDAESGAGGPAGGPIDPAALAAYRDFLGEADPGFVARLIGIYLEDLAEQLAALAAATSAAQMSTLAASAHRLKGGSANIGAHRLAALCAEIEQAARAGDGARAAELLAAVSTEADRVVPALEAMRAQEPAR